ncbi:GNAT family protein [Actinoplanes sp. NPDC049548]|uniref:GNAT family N-acetyltransferase n=1 Tax=Actinoplanes sp. NPDC049548 TaxID=3155152 RepID=UPI0034238394
MNNQTLRTLADGYHDRTTRSLGARSLRGHLVKLYAVEARGRTVGAEQEQAALELAARHLEDHRDSTGLAVVILHAGEDGDYLIVQSWVADYMTRQTILVGPPSAPEEMRPAPAGAGPCVWELGILARERDAYVDAVLVGTGPIEECIRAWAWDQPRPSPWREAAPMYGERVILEPLDLSHAPGLLAATADDEVWRHLHLNRPADVSEMTAIIAGALSEHDGGERVPWVVRDVGTGTVVGTTSYYDLSEGRESLAIGHTVLGRPWWRTGINAEAKLLLLARAFEELAAERVEWHVDTANERSQRAVERLGATREGVIRHHHRRQSGGARRDMVLYGMTADEWPAARARLSGTAGLTA